MSDGSFLLSLTDFGFAPAGAGWERKVGGRTVRFEPLHWQHSQAWTFDIVDGERVDTDALSLVVQLQMKTWGMPPEDLVPVNVLAIIPDTGGSVIIAFDPEIGFNADGWLGFVIGFGGTAGHFVSHMMGVREDRRSGDGVGWALKVVQAHEALKAGHRTMSWTYDPMRGANARLNLEKLGARIYDYTIDKYGVLRSTLYGTVPSDRFQAHWALDDPRTIERLTAVLNGSYRGRSLAEAGEIPEATIENAAELAASHARIVRVAIPGDIDQLMRSDPAKAISWRQDLRTILPHLLKTKMARSPKIYRQHPGDVTSVERQGSYAITRFATGLDDAGVRQSYYLLERLDDL